MNEKNQLINKLHRLEQEHRDLDEILIQLQEKKTVNLLQIQRLKKRKGSTRARSSRAQHTERENS